MDSTKSLTDSPPLWKASFLEDPENYSANFDDLSRIKDILDAHGFVIVNNCLDSEECVNAELLMRKDLADCVNSKFLKPHPDDKDYACFLDSEDYQRYLKELSGLTDPDHVNVNTELFFKYYADFLMRYGSRSDKENPDSLHKYYAKFLAGGEFPKYSVPGPVKRGFVTLQGLPHGQFAWKLRTNLTVKRIFAHLHNCLETTEDLKTSTDEKLCVSLDVPFFNPSSKHPELSDAWPHADQNVIYSRKEESDELSHMVHQIVIKVFCMCGMAQEQIVLRRWFCQILM